MRPGKIAGHIESKLFMAWWCFNHDVLRMQLSDLNEIEREPTSGIRPGCARRSGDPTSRILRVTEEEASSHDRFSRILWLRTVSQAQMTLQMLRGPRWRAMMIVHDSQSSLASV